MLATPKLHREDFDDHTDYLSSLNPGKLENLVASDFRD